MTVFTLSDESKRIVSVHMFGSLAMAKAQQATPVEGGVLRWGTDRTGDMVIAVASYDIDGVQKSWRIEEHEVDDPFGKYSTGGRHAG